jgi:hypothetical protein
VALLPAAVTGVVLYWRHRILVRHVDQELEMMVKVNVLMESALREAQADEHILATAPPERSDVVSF